MDDGSNAEATEGHAARGKALDDGSNDDTDGHVKAGQQPGKPRISRPNGDTEGHAARRPGLDDGSNDDAEGHTARIKG